MLSVILLHKQYFILPQDLFFVFLLLFFSQMELHSKREAYRKTNLNANGFIIL